MALRHPFPLVELGDLRKTEHSTVTVTKPRRAKTIQFRKGKDIADVVKEMSGFNRIQLNAAVGSGKSTLVPAALAASKEVPVIHVVPSRNLAWALFDYVGKQNPVGGVTLCLKPSDPIGVTGVTITYAACVFGWAMVKTVEQTFTEYPNGVILYLDESHESDGYMNFLLKAGHIFGGVECVVEASATHDPEKMSMAELEGKCVSEFYSDPPSRWDPADESKPWSFTSLDDNVLIFLDDEEIATNLIQKYNRGGVTAYRLTARMPVESFARIYRQLSDPKSGIIVMVADYSFRSGFTFPVTRIIDSGLVKYYTIESSQQVCRSRMMYKLEKYQAQHRGGRIAGSTCTYYYPNVEFASALCGLEGIEAELSALLYRLAGFLPPPELSVVLMAKGRVPSDFCKAVNGSVALPLLSINETWDLVKEADPVAVEDVVEDIMRGYADSQDELQNPLVDYFSAFSCDDTPAVRSADGGLGFLQQLKQLSGEQAVLIPGRYYTTPGLPVTDVMSELYGGDWQTALREIQEKPYLVGGFTRSQRIELIALFLSEYNTKVAIMAGIESMLEAQQSLTKMVTRYPEYVREWSDYVANDLREAKSVQNSLIQGLGVLTMPGMVFHPMLPDIAIENQVSRGYADRLMKAIGKVDKTVDGQSYLNYIRGRIKDVDPPPESEYDKLTIESKPTSEAIQVRLMPVSVGKKNLWDLEFRIPDGLMWNEEACAETLSYYLSTTGMSARHIRKLVFQGTKIRDAGRILRMVVDSDDYHKRKSVTMKFHLTEKNRKRLTYSGK